MAKVDSGVSVKPVEHSQYSSEGSKQGQGGKGKGREGMCMALP